MNMNIDVPKNGVSDNQFSFYCGIVIKRIRKEKGLTGIELAKNLDISQQQISRYERGINKLSIDVIFDILAVLDISFEKLFRYTLEEIRNSSSEDTFTLKNKISILDSAYFY
ncbi:transcriptional regulator with XRE-family HTH domain [Providencia alcalifaciens]|nr:transcriptional regulator with XRE-family HTH domain [Providencia alcalifaciens]